MGFGSYDEGEQQQQDVSSEDDEESVVNVHEHEYDGELTVENGDSTDDLLGQLQEIKESNAESEE